MSAYMSSKSTGAICILGAPFDSTTSFRPGSRFGPGAIREASYGLETFSPALNADLDDCSYMDLGDLELPFGDPNPALDLIEEAIRKIFSQEKIPLLLGGEHLVSLGAVRAAAKLHPDLTVVHLDAHADLRDDYLGQKMSHATVMKRVCELLGPHSLRQIGVRSCTREEHALVSELKSIPESIALRVGARPCYLTCDLDILDPSVLPGTGTPEPGGMSFQELIAIMVTFISRLNIVGMDVVELAPHLDPTGVSAVVAAKVVRECLIALDRSLNNRQGASDGAPQLGDTD
jgi:agmatinase